MSDFILNAQARKDTEQGKGSSRRLRREARLPAIIYGAGKEPQSITLELRELVKKLTNDAFYSSIIEIDVDGKKESAVIKALQRHPAKNTPMHADFLRIKAGEAILMNIPIQFENQETAKGVKEGGMVNISADVVEVSTLPKDLPDNIVVDLADLEIGDVIRLSDLKLPKGVTIPSLAHGEDYDQPIVTISVVHDTPDEDPDSAAAEDEAKAEDKPEEGKE